MEAASMSVSTGFLIGAPVGSEYLWLVDLVVISNVVCLRSRAREAMRSVVPDQLLGDTFDSCLEDSSVRSWLAMLRKAIEEPAGPEQ